jgi:hypothetical protein
MTDITSHLHKLIETHGFISTAIKVPFMDYLSQKHGKKIDMKETNRTLSKLVDERRVVRVTFGKHMYYAASPEQQQRLLFSHVIQAFKSDAKVVPEKPADESQEPTIVETVKLAVNSNKHTDGLL